MIRYKDINELREALLELNSSGASWAQLGEELGVSGALLWKIANKGHYPKDYKILHRLGLPSISTVEGINPIPEGSLALEAKYCNKCNRPFIPNHWARGKCFICSPYRPWRERSK